MENRRGRDSPGAVSCRIRTKLLIPVALLMMAAALYSTLSKEWGRSSPEPPKPLSVDVVEAEPTGKARPTSGMRIGRDGFGTILSAPARHVTVPEKPPAAEAAMQTAEPPAPSQVAGLVRIVARLTPEPPAKEPTLTLENAAATFRHHLAPTWLPEANRAGKAGRGACRPTASLEALRRRRWLSGDRHASKRR